MDNTALAGDDISILLLFSLITSVCFLPNVAYFLLFHWMRFFYYYYPPFSSPVAIEATKTEDHDEAVKLYI